MIMRFKNRYLLLEFRFLTDKDRHTALSGLSEKQLRQIVKDTVLNLLGDYGWACVSHSLNVKYLNVITDVAILRVPRDYYRNVWSAITTLTSVQNTPCSLNVIHIGGTIKSCQKYLVRYNYDKLKKMLETAKTGVERKKMHSKIKEVLKKDSLPLNI